jgi:hypothetical protein
VSADLIAFLTARLDEDEAVAKRAADRMGSPDWRQGEADDGRDIVMMGEHEVGMHSLIGAHIARHDPARVFREVEAGRAILAEYDRALVKAPGNVPLISTLKRLMQARAEVYSDHPDYDQAWRPA